MPCRTGRQSRLIRPWTRRSDVEYEPPLPPSPPVVEVTVDMVQAMLNGTPVPAGTYVVGGVSFQVDDEGQVTTP
jgi:hypothetical protein